MWIQPLGILNLKKKRRSGTRHLFIAIKVPVCQSISYGSEVAEYPHISYNHLGSKVYWAASEHVIHILFIMFKIRNELKMVYSNTASCALYNL